MKVFAFDWGFLNHQLFAIFTNSETSTHLSRNRSSWKKCPLSSGGPNSYSMPITRITVTMANQLSLLNPGCGVGLMKNEIKKVKTEFSGKIPKINKFTKKTPENCKLKTLYKNKYFYRSFHRPLVLLASKDGSHTPLVIDDIASCGEDILGYLVYL